MSAIANPAPYTLQWHGRRFEVAVGSGWRSRAVMRVDGEQVDEAEMSLGDVRLEAPELVVKVSWGLLGQVKRCIALPADQAGREIPLIPPPGTRAARLAELANERPRLYAARHVAVAVAQVLVAVIGLGAIFAGLLPAFPLPDLPVPDINLPELPLPNVSLPNLEVPGWISAILASSKFWLPIAIGVAIREVQRRRDPSGAGTAPRGRERE